MRKLLPVLPAAVLSAAALLSAAAFLSVAVAPAAAQVSTAPSAKPTDPRQTAASLAAQVPASRPEDVKSPEAIVAACYDVISGPAGPRNWDRFRSLFLPSARLTAASTKPDGTHVVTLLSVDDYVKLAGAGFMKSGFYEQPMHNDLQVYGNMGQVFTSYESRRAPGEKPFQRGINSFQVAFDGQRWWVVSILWDDERKDNPIPPNMLQQEPPKK
jgi:hypothetical protein